MQSVLIANRGEIAVRIVRACRDLGLRSVAVFSEADREAPQALLADEAHLLGPAPSAESYLVTERLLALARAAEVDAVHPGYGFLSERADFARAVEEAGLIFVGPSPETIRVMGDKAEARRTVEAAGLRVVPGTSAPVSDTAEALASAAEIGYPVLLKAVAGGGGKGMRVVASSAELPRALEAARREAQGAFGEDAVYLERYLDRPRHIEIQLLGDGRGHVVHLGERECSIQRRHQKILEEAPSPVLTPDLRNAMGEAAMRAARAVNYRGAGTVEFLFQDGEFFFIEMNTRIQVEHPLTEFVTGIDLVRWQLRLAGGEPLGLVQEEIGMRGHAIECRITAEDPFAGFLPCTGVIQQLDAPSGPGVRWDGGVGIGSNVGLHYDPLLGKLIVHGATRTEAIRKMQGALDELVIQGVSTSTAFLRRIVREADFLQGNLTTRYLEEHPELADEEQGIDGELRTVAVAAALLESEWRRSVVPPRIEEKGEQLSAWRSAFGPRQGLE